MPFPPLIAPGADLSEAERLRTARQSRLPAIGDSGQRRLAAARVAVLGAGGIGSPVTLYLAASGVGTVGIIDDDTVDLSNLQRQIAFGAADVGRPKATVAAERLRALAPEIAVIEHHVRLTADNAASLLGAYDLVIDGSDSFDTRYAVADACDLLGIPLVWGSVLQFDAQVSVFWSRPPGAAPVSLRDVFPVAPAAGTVPSCAEAGVLSALCGQVGSLLVSEATKLICGIGDPLLGRMLVIDALRGRMREIPLTPAGDTDKERPVETAPPPPTAATISLAELAELAEHQGATLFDVREPEEFATGSIPGARSLPLSTLLADPAAVPLSGPTVIFCQQGPRARAARDALAAAHPGAALLLLAGGYAAWVADHDTESAR